MKLITVLSAGLLITCTCLLSACASAPSSQTPSIGGQAPATSRVPSPGNIHATEMNQSQRMTLPTAQ